MKATLHSIELEHNGVVFATFRNEKEYDEYLGGLSVDYHDGDFEINSDYTVWYCVFEGGDIISITEEQYKIFGR